MLSVETGYGLEDVDGEDGGGGRFRVGMMNGGKDVGSCEGLDGMGDVWLGTACGVALSLLSSEEWKGIRLMSDAVVPFEGL